VIITPVHQFEIRYSTIINFTSVVRPVIAPFVKLASRVIIDNENLITEKITLIFDDEFYHISVFSDRIIFRCERFDTSDLANNNSFIEEPFFNIYDKISQLPDFGTTNSILYFTFYVNTQTSKKIETLRKEFIESNFSSNSCVSMISGLTDIAVTLEAKEEDGSALSISTGPYLGIEDINKRNFNISDKKLLGELENLGQIIDYKHFMLTSKANFGLYKGLNRKANTIIRQRWEK
jgi:hypothetical protein